MKDGNPESPSGLPRIEWDFVNVPKSELVACCYWEYARESASIRDTAERYNPYGTTDVEKEVARLYSLGSPRLPGVGIPAAIFLEVICDAEKFPESWQSLSPDERASLVGQLLVRADPIRAVPHDRLAVRVARVLLKEAETPKENPDRLSVVWMDSQSPTGLETLILDIGWAWFTNNQISTAFAQWVEHNRPPMIPEPKEKMGGHKLVDWRNKLRDLGVMRLLNFCTVTGMPLPTPRGCPEAARRYAGWTDSQWSAARRRALKDFRELFLFLPKGELPIHAPTSKGKGKL